MTIYFQCPQCNSTKSVADEHAGKSGKCKCGAIVKVPYPTKSPEAFLEEYSPPDQETVEKIPSAYEMESDGDSKTGDWFLQSSTDASTGTNSNSGGIFDGLLPPINEHNSAAKQTASWDYQASQANNNDYRESSAAYPSNRRADARHSPDCESSATESDWSEFFVKGSILGVLLSGPLMLVYGRTYESSVFFYIGCAISFFWIPILSSLEEEGYFGIYLEILGFGGLKRRESLKRAVKLLLVALCSMSVVFGAVWIALVLTEPLTYQNAEVSKPIATDKGAVETEKARALAQEARESQLRESIEHELMSLASQAAARLATKRVIVEPESQLPSERIELWKPCVDVQGSDYTSRLIMQFGGDKKITASPNSRFFLHNQALHDFETRSKKVLNGRRYSLVSPANADRLVPLEISPDGGFILFKLLSDDSKGTQSGTLVVQEFDNSVVKVLPGCEEGYFLGSNKLLIKESKTDAYYCLSGAGFNEKSPLITEKLLDLSPNRRYVAFVQEKVDTNSNDALKSDQSKSPEVKNRLIIRETESLTDVAIATFEGVEDLKKGFFSPDGSRILVVGNHACAAVSLVDGKRGLLLELKPNQVCEGWYGFESRYVCAKTNFESVGTGVSSDRDNAKDALFLFGDVALGGWVMQVKNLDVNQPYRVFRSTCLRNEDSPSDLRVVPKSTLDSLSDSFNTEQNIAIPKSMDLKVTSDWGHQGAIEVVMKEFITRSLGLESATFTANLRLNVKVVQEPDKPVQVELVATNSGSKVVWEATAQLDPRVKLSSDLEQQIDIGSMFLFGLADVLNKTLDENPFPTTLRSFNSPQVRYDNDLTQYDKFPHGMPLFLDFKVSETIDVDNTWYGTDPLFDVSRAPLIDYNLPVSLNEQTGTNAKFVGFVENKRDVAIVLQHPKTGVFQLDLKNKGEVSAIEIGEDFSQLEFLSNGDLLILYKNQIKLLDSDNKKSPKSITLPAVGSLAAVSADGNMLAVGIEGGILCYDLARLRARPSDVTRPKFEASFSDRRVRGRFSPNGKWLAGLDSSKEQRGILVDLANRKAISFLPDPRGGSLHVDNNGRIRYIDEAANVFEGATDSTGNIVSFEDLGIQPLPDSWAFSISSDGTRMIRSDRYGRIEVLAIPSGELIESLWDPGFIDDVRRSGGPMGWAPSGKKFYWLQGNRLLVWESVPSVSDPK